MIQLRVNGKPVELPGPTRLLDYVRQLGVDSRAIAVEVNGEILQRDGYAGCTLADGDVVEIVRMVGGGTRGPHAVGTAPLLRRRGERAPQITEWPAPSGLDGRQSQLSQRLLSFSALIPRHRAVGEDHGPLVPLAGQQHHVARPRPLQGQPDR